MAWLILARKLREKSGIRGIIHNPKTRDLHAIKACAGIGERKAERRETRLRKTVHPNSEIEGILKSLFQMRLEVSIPKIRTAKKKTRDASWGLMSPPRIGLRESKVASHRTNTDQSARILGVTKIKSSSRVRTTLLLLKSHPRIGISPRIGTLAI